MRCKCNAHTVKGIFLGQAFSLLIALGGFFGNRLAGTGILLPLGQSIPMYFIMAVFSIPYTVKRRNLKPTKPFWRYLVIGTLDVQANYATMWAYAKGSLTIISILQLLSLPAAMVTSIIFGLARYSAVHYVCAVGAAIGMVASVLVAGLSGPGSVPEWLSSLVGALGSLLYGVINGLIEKLASDSSPLEYITFIGLSALPVCAIESAASEFNGWKTSTYSWEGFGYECGYTAALGIQYTLIPVFLTHWPVSTLNMAYLTIGVYGMVLDWLVVGSDISPYEVICVVWIISFVVVFVMKPIQRKSIETGVPLLEVVGVENSLDDSNSKIIASGEGSDFVEQIEDSLDHIAIVDELSGVEIQEKDEEKQEGNVGIEISLSDG